MDHGKSWKSLMRVHLGEYEQLEAELRRVAHENAFISGRNEGQNTNARTPQSSDN
jgi:hypothetical protein